MLSKAYFVTGLTHVDLAWVRDSTHYAECMENVVVRMLDLLESDPSFTYVIEQIAHYRALASTRPDLIRRLAAFVREGRVEVAGAMASSIDMNGPNGECIVRNHLLGRRWARRNLGADVRVGDLIDTFGICAQSPQIHRQFGMPYLLANRLGGGIHETIFDCRGLDGSTITIAGRDVHAAYVRPGRFHMNFTQGRTELVDRLFDEAAASEIEGLHLVIVYDENERVPLGHGRRQTDRRNGRDDAAWKSGTLGEFFAALGTTNVKLTTVDGDLNPGFTGRYSLRPGVRLRNRRVETLLLEAEKWATLLGVDGWKNAMDGAWWLMSYVQSHDVYTGSFPTRVLHEVNGWLDSAEQTADGLLDRALGPDVSCCASDDTSIAATVYNGLPWRRRDVAAFNLPRGWSGLSRVVGEDGEEAIFDVSGDRAEIMVETPAVGAASYVLERGEAETPDAPATVDRASIENEFLRIDCSAERGLECIWLKEADGPIATDCGGLLIAQKDEGTFQVESITSGEVPALDGVLRLCPPRTCGVGQRIRLSGSFPRLPWAGEGNRLDWELHLTLRPGQPRLDVGVRLDWLGEATRVRLHLPTRINSSKGIFEVPFGTVRRKPYNVRSWSCRGEWPAHRFVALEDGALGLGIVNNGTMGVEIADGDIRTSLLRAPATPAGAMVPDDTSSQHGRHEFAFCLVPYTGDLARSSVLQAAQECNTPLLVRGAKAMQQSFLRLSPSACVLSAVKRPEDGQEGEAVIRIYESLGAGATAHLDVAGLQQAWLSNLLEERLDPIPRRDESLEIPLKPYEIKTLRVRR